MDKQQGPSGNTGNYIQYLVINHNGKEYEKKTASSKLLWLQLNLANDIKNMWIMYTVYHNSITTMIPLSKKINI